ncbi:hypothetical protein K502DRAFT_329066 [Neoconidiobolus thromboides FSU 785]|nr:hypothetical protein K502DRAFT_329066 [Neoconidiobolus thromboides FSU 785]
MSDSDVEDCFELVEYMTNANKLDYIDFFENNLRKWFLNNAENTNDSNRSELVDFCKIKDNTFQLKCHIYPSLKNKSFDKSEFNLEDILNLSSNLFLCQPFLYHPDPNDETKFDISYNYEANNYHRWMGFPVILELSSENQNQEKKNVILVEDLTKKEVKEKKVSHNIDPEAISQLLDTTKQVLKKLKLYNIPLVLSNGVQSKKNFEGLIYITLDDNATKSTERHEKEFIQAYIYSNASSINPTAFSDLEKVVDFYKDLSRRHFKGNYRF